MSLCAFHGVLIATHLHTKITPAQIVSKNRSGSVVRVRQAGIYAMFQRSEWSSGVIARNFGLTDHSTALYARDKVEALLQADFELARLVRVLIAAPKASMIQFDAYRAALDNAPQVKAPRRGPVLTQAERKAITPRPDTKPAHLADLPPSRIKWFASLDADGFCYGERYQEHDMRRGSEKLRAAIARARAA